MTYYALGIESVSALLRLLHNNPFIADACGVGDEMPSQPTLSRFGAKLSKKLNALAVKNLFRKLTVTLYETLPDLGKNVAIDSTDVKAWSNGGKKGKRTRPALKRHPRRPGKVSDPDAGYCVKSATDGYRKFVFGYKVHILADAKYELPLAINVSAGNVHDVKRAPALLSEARFVHGGRFHPEYVTADAGYSSDPLRHLVRRQYQAEPVIDPNAAHKRAVQKTNKTEEWRAIYKTRTAVERVNARLKGFYKLNDVRVRTILKVRVHMLMANILLLTTAVAFPGEPRSNVR